VARGRRASDALSWIGAPVRAGRDDRTYSAAHTLDIPVPQALGHIYLVWAYAAEWFPDGVFINWRPELIAQIAQWRGDPELFLQAFTESPLPGRPGWLYQTATGEYALTEWESIAGRFIKRRRMGTEWHRARPTVLVEVIERDGFICQICGEPVSEDELSLDHIYPKSKGGPHVPENLRVAHKRCNSKKGARV
jgi:hypothetical protein